MPDERPLSSVAKRLAATQRVLVVEDEQDIADFLRAYFRASGYDLVHVDPDSPEEVLAAVDELEPDCVLLDLNLRGFNGAEAYDLLCQDPRHAHLPVVVVSARPDAQSLVAARGGLDAFVTKPFHVASLADLVVERIASAERLAAKAGGRQGPRLLTHEEVEARLVEEIARAAGEEAGRPTCFALARLRRLDDIALQVGDAGASYVRRELARRLPALLPAAASLGITAGGEVALLLPDTDEETAGRLLVDATDRLGTMRLPGGAEVPLAFTIGLAAFPRHAADADSLYMAADAALAEAVDRGERLVVAL